jgi:ergothioneine biosynthesis protein EgtB
LANPQIPDRSNPVALVDPEAAPEQVPVSAVRYAAVRRFSEALCTDLAPEDLVPQSMPDASPTKWHLAHTTWFFETFVLLPFLPGHTPHHPRYGYLFNSYYNGAGERHARPQRGMLTRPTVTEVMEYRAAIDAGILRALEQIQGDDRSEVLRRVEIGLHHEQQHQELMLTDLKHLFSLSALHPAYRSPLPLGPGSTSSLEWIRSPAAVRSIGHSGPCFAFDNEGPRHRIFVEAFALADRPITNGEYLEFVEDGGYSRPEPWLDMGWATLQQEGWTHPMYWRAEADGWAEFTLAGMRELAPDEPVSHISYIEADAFARWAGARLPTEGEWESAFDAVAVEGNFVESGRVQPAPMSGQEAGATPGLRQGFGDVWEWTQSAYAPYPGYRPESGMLGEYNGKFMCNQLVLRGGSCASSRTHLRHTYRNFFHAPDRWQFSGLRLAKDC